MESKDRVAQMKDFLRNFNENPERLEKYLEFLMFQEGSDPHSLMTRKEGLLHADSPTNLMWRLENDFHAAAKAAAEPEEDPDDEPSFTEITLDVKH